LVDKVSNGAKMSVRVLFPPTAVWLFSSLCRSKKKHQQRSNDCMPWSCGWRSDQVLISALMVRTFRRYPLNPLAAWFRRVKSRLAYVKMMPVYLICGNRQKHTDGPLDRGKTSTLLPNFPAVYVTAALRALVREFFI